MSDAAGLIGVSVSRRPAIWFCVDPEAGDSEADWMLEHGWIEPPEVTLLLDGLPPGGTVLDAGCGVGVFALAAAAAGAEVLAVDACAANVELVRTAVRRNGFERVRVLCAASLADLDLGRPDAVRLRDVMTGAPRTLFEAPAVVLDARPSDERRDVLMVDGSRSRVLVRTATGRRQPHAGARYAMLERVPDSWRIEPPLDDDRVLRRLIDEAASPDAGRRAHAARLLAPWAHPAAESTLGALAIDLDPHVRAQVGEVTSRPALDPRPSTGETVVLAASLSLPGTLRNAHLHVRAGQYLGVLAAPGEGGGSALLEAIAGLLAPCGGTLEVLVRPTLVSGLAEALQPSLSVAQNLELLAAFAGADVTDVDRRLPELARAGGFAQSLSLRLSEAGTAVAAQVMVCVALRCTPGSLILLDGLPATEDHQLRARSARRVRELLHDGISIIQCVRELRELLARPDRLVWISDGRIVHDGHAESVAAAAENLLAGARA